MHFSNLGRVALLATSVVAAPHKPRAPQYAVNKERADAVKQAFQTSWDGYSKYAFPHDSLRPVSNGFADDRCALCVLSPACGKS